MTVPFAIAASYQTSQYATGTYTQGGSQVFSHLNAPPTSGTTAETAADAAAHAVGFSPFSAHNEVQTVTIGGTPTGGTFTLSFGGKTTATIAFNAAATTVATRLTALSSIPAATGGTNAVQTLTITGVPTGGTFTVTFGGQTTSALAFNAAASAVQTAFLALSSVGAGNATVTGSAGGPYTITFTGTLAKSPQATVTASGASLTGGTSPGVTPASLTTGVLPTQNVTVTGSAGGPYTVTFVNLLASENVALLGASGSALTGGTSPTVTVTTATPGEAAFVNSAKLDATRQRDGMRDQYDSASGNHF